MTQKLQAFIFDVDGVLANNNHRQHLLNPTNRKVTNQDWIAFYEAGKDDSLYQDTAHLLKTLQAAGYKILLVTGRSEDYEAQLRLWLRDFAIEPDYVFMRRHLDFRKDWQIKEEIWKTQIEPFFNVLGVFEDRRDCVMMWRGYGLTCYQPREATY